MPAAPPITVAIPTRNRPGFLLRAIRSVLQQTHADFELLVVDNHSDETGWMDAPELADERVRVLRHQEKLSVANSWNSCIAAGRGDAICILHDDDVLYPEFLAETSACLYSDGGVGMAFPMMRKVDCVGTDLGIHWTCDTTRIMSGREYILTVLRAFGAISLPTSVLVRRSAYAAAGLYGHGISNSSYDLNMMLRIAMRYDVGVVGRVLFDYTLHPSQLTEPLWRQNRSPQGLADSCLEVLAAAIWYMETDPGCERVPPDLVSALQGVRQCLTVYVTDRDEQWSSF